MISGSNIAGFMTFPWIVLSIWIVLSAWVFLKKKDVYLDSDGQALVKKNQS